MALPTTHLHRNDSTLYEDAEYSNSDLTITEATLSPNTPSFLLRDSSTFGVIDGSTQSSRATLNSTDGPSSSRESIGPSRRSTYPSEFLSPVPSLEDIEKCCTRSMTSVASDSDNERGVEPSPTGIPIASPSAVESHYLNYVRLLSLDLPHLAYSPIRPQHGIVSLAVLGYSACSPVCRTQFTHHGPASSLSEAEMSNITQVLQDCARPTKSDIDTSLIIAEDLSCEVIELLGSSFGLSPEFFETHLINSRYARPSPKRMPLPQSIWPTASLPTGFQSIIWFRPVWRSSGTGVQKLWDSYRRQPFHELIAGSPRNRPRHGLLYFANNIIRFGWNLSKEPQGFLEGNKEDPPMDDPGMPVAWEERATFCIKTFGDRRCIILLLDPLPVVKETGTTNRSGNASECHGDIDTEQNGQGNHDYAVFHDMYLRGPNRIPLHEADINNCPKIREKLRESISTYSYLKQSYEAENKHSSRSTPNDPLQLLNAIICHDSFNLLRVINNTLDDIQCRLADGHLTETQLCHWYEFIKRCEANIPTLQATLSSLPVSSQGISLEQSSRRTTQLPKDALTATAATSARLHEISASLTSAITFLGSRQDIAKGKSISRLCEAVFFFSPIVASASIFGMRVNELNHAPIWAFFVLCGVLMLLSYGLRWIMAIDIDISKRCKRLYSKWFRFSDESTRSPGSTR